MKYPSMIFLAAITFNMSCRQQDSNPAIAATFTPANKTKASESETAKTTNDAPAIIDKASLPEQKNEQDSTDFELPGVAAAIRSTRLSMKTGGILDSIKTREGTWVKTGQPLCSLNTIDLRLRVEGAEVTFKQAQAGVQNAEQDLKRASELFKGGAATDQSIEKAELGLIMAKLQAQAAEVALKAARQSLYDATLRAPFSGIVTKLFAEEGMMITTMPPTAILQLVDTSTLEVLVHIPERMVQQIKVDQKVLVQLPAIKIERHAKVDRIPEVVDPETRSLSAYIHVDNKDRLIPANLYARVRFLGLHTEATSNSESMASGVH
ncbi:MAG: efflux RND transporter periplasmic adaptor subunit [Deltaproteobacteria bacterium]|nr:efflux RND transporter periplasmic adaptor subunit [Deltaproteobacteria bacterium]